MKFIFRFVLILLISVLSLTGCIDKSGFNQEPLSDVENNTLTVFNVKFDKEHDWKTSYSKTIELSDIPENAAKVQILAYVLEEGDTVSTLYSLNEVEVNGKKKVSVKCDIPSVNLGMFAKYITKDGSAIFKKIESSSVAGTRGYSDNTEDFLNQLNQVTLPKISSTISSYAADRGWIPNEKLYEVDRYSSIEVEDYDQDFKDVFRAVIFSYFKNGRKYNNLPLVTCSGLYNDNGYPFSTGDEPIVITPVYKNDGGYKEVENSDLYYYYFKEEDLGDNPVAYLESLPKYKALEFKDCIGKDDEIIKKHSFVLAYYGDGVQEVGKEGSFTFPAGYKIGFMVRAKTTAENGKKQGELYGDGRLNNYINSYKNCNFKSSNLGTDGPRLAWICVNDKNLMCLESGTDTDFNDIIIEIEGGVYAPVFVPEVEMNTYTFLFEDRKLGDYDMNDVVIKAKRISSTKVEYSVVACGANDELFIKNINGNTINDSREVHSLFNVSTSEFVNTVRGLDIYDPIVEVVSVNENFSFLDEDTQPYIFDKTADYYVRVSKKGEDPHAIMIPNDFKWPTERTCVKDAYPRFNSWGQNRVTSTNWYLTFNENKVFNWF